MYLDSSSLFPGNGQFSVKAPIDKRFSSPLPPPYSQGLMGTMHEYEYGYVFQRPDRETFVFSNATQRWESLGLWSYIEEGVEKIGEGFEYLGRKVRQGYNYVAEKVKDFDKWMRDNVPGWGFVSDIVIDIGSEAKVFLVKAANGLIEVAIYTAATFVALAVSSVCAAGIANGIPIPPYACAMLAGAAFSATAGTLNRFKDDVKRGWNSEPGSDGGGPPADSPSANPTNNGLQAMQMGFHSDTCGMPAGWPTEPDRLITYMGREPNPNLSACGQKQHWEAYREQARLDPMQQIDLPYYDCRVNTASTNCEQEKLRGQGFLTKHIVVSNLIPANVLARNSLSTLAKLSLRPVETVPITTMPLRVPPLVQGNMEAERAKNEARRKRSIQALKAANEAQSDSDYTMWLALALVGGAGVYYAKKKGMF